MLIPLYLTMLFSFVLSDDGFREARTAHWRAEGRQEAERDIAAGEMKFKIYGYMAGISERDVAFSRLMRDRFAVKVEAVAQCVVTEELVERSEGYNTRIEEELDAKVGPNAIQRAHADSAWWVQQRPGRYGLLALLVLFAGLFVRWRFKRSARGSKAPSQV